MTGADLNKQYEIMQGNRSLVWSTWIDINRYVLPRKKTTLLKTTAGQRQTEDLYDSTALKANRDLSCWMHSNLSSMAMPWFSLSFGEGDIEVPRDAQVWLEAGRKKEFESLAASNFTGQMQEFYLDLPSFCTSAIYMDEADGPANKWNGYEFRCLAPGEYCFELGKDGKVATLFREFKLSAQVAVDKWGYGVSEKTKSLVQSRPLEQVNFVHGVFPSNWFGGGHKTFLPFASYYYERETKKVVSQGGFHEFPFFVVPWDRSSGETYGNGPGWDALPDIKTLNRAIDLGLSEWALSFRPPLGVLDDGVIGSVRLKPGGITIFKKLDAVKQFITQARFSDNRIKEEDLRTSVKNIFHADKVNYLPAPEETGKMTAYEVSRRYQLMQMLLGPTFGNITNDGFDPMIERGFNMLLRKNALPAPPESVIALLREGRRETKVQYEGPLARAQRSGEIMAINDAISSAKPLIEADPQVLDNLNTDDSFIHILQLSGVPAKLIRPKKGKDSVQNLRDARAARQQKQDKLAEASSMADSAGKLGGLMDKVSPQGAETMAKMMGQAGTA